jgi:hypothetical protein
MPLESPGGPAEPHAGPSGANVARPLLVLHIDPCRGSGVDWHLSGKATWSPAQKQTLETVKHHLKPFRQGSVGPRHLLPVHTCAVPHAGQADPYADQAHRVESQPNAAYCAVNSRPAVMVGGRAERDRGVDEHPPY